MNQLPVGLKEADRVDILTVIDNYVDVLLRNTDVVTRPPQAVDGNIPTDTLLAELKDGQPFTTASQKFNLATQKTGFFKRNDSIPTIGNERDIARIAFRLSENDKLPELRQPPQPQSRGRIQQLHNLRQHRLLLRTKKG